MYVAVDPAADNSVRSMKALPGEGMPAFKNPIVCGNLFLSLKIQFPERLTKQHLQLLATVLPPPLLNPKFQEDDTTVEIHELVDLDPFKSYEENKDLLRDTKEAYDEDEDEDNEDNTDACAMM